MATKIIEDGKRWCNGCKKYLSVDHFGVDKSTKSGLSPRCMECNRERSHNNYLKNKHKRKRISMNIQKEKKPLFRPLKMHPPEGTFKKRCPECKAVLWVCPDQKEGSCQKCSTTFDVVRSLSDTKRRGRIHGFYLRARSRQEYDPAPEILKKVSAKPYYLLALSRNVSVSYEKTRDTVKRLEESGLVTVTRGQNYTLVKSC